MKFIRKITALLLTATIMLSLVVVGQAQTESKAIISLSGSENIVGGETATFTATLANNPGFAAMVLDYKIVDGTGQDVTSGFEHVANEDGDWLLPKSVLLKSSGAVQGTFTGNGEYINWNHSANVTKNGELFSMDLRPKKDELLNGSYTISLGLRENKESNFGAATDIPGQATPVAVEFVAFPFTLTGALNPEDLQPKITKQPESKTYTYGETAADLTVEATPAATAAEDSLTYKWFSNTTNSTTGGTQIENATEANYTPTLSDFGTIYYYCVVSNDVNGKTYSATSNVAAVTYEQAQLPTAELLTSDDAAYTDTSYTYDGSQKTVKVKVGDLVENTDYTVSGDRTGTNAGSYNVTVKPAENGNYIGEAQTLPWSIAKAEITTNANPTMTIYTNGQAFPIADTVLSVATKGSQTATVTYSVKSGAVELDTSNKTLKATGNLESTAVVTANISADNHESKTVDIQVAIKTKNDVSGQLTFTAQSGPFTYDETKKALTTYVNAANYTGTAVEGSSITYMLDNKPVQLTDQMVLDAGKHIFVATYDDPTNNGVQTVEIDIAKKEIIPTVTWPSTTYTYNGEVQTIAATVGNTDKVEIVGYTNATQTNAGTYSVTANLQLKADAAKNYKLADSIPTAVHSWEIAKATHDALTDTVTIRFNQTDARQYTAAQILAKDAKFVEVTNLAASKTDSDNLLATVTPNAGNTAIEYKLADNLPDPGDTPKTATIAITFDSTNYTNTTLTLTVNVTSKTPVESTFLTVPAKTVTYSGVAQEYTGANYTGTKEGAGTYTYTYTDAESNPVTNPQNAGTYTVTATYTDDAYICTNTGTFTIAPAPLSITAATVSNKEYDKSDVAAVTDVTITGTVNSETLTKDTDYEVSAKFDNANVGDGKAVTVTVTMKDTPKANNYTLTPNTFATTANITKKTVTPTVTLSANSFVFNNTEQKPTVTVTYADGDQTVTMDASEYIVTYGEDCTNVGTVTVKVEANSSNYTFEDKTATYTITKATATLSPVNKSYKFGTAVEDTVTLPTLTNPGTNPAVEYSVGTPTDANGILDGDPTVTDGVVSYKIKGTGTNGQTATIPVTITSQNYNDVTVNVVITLTDKNVPTVSANDITKVYDGEDLSGITGTATFDGAAVPGTWSIVSPVASEVKNASATAYNVTVLFTPTDEDTYAAVEDQITVTINKAQPVIQPTFTPITEAGKTLADADLKAFPDTMAGTPGTIAWDDGNATAVVANQSYGWTFTPTDTTNYETATGTLIPFVQNPPDETEEPNVPPILPPSGGNGSGSTGGGTGGSGSGSGNQGGSTTNPDQSVTTTTTDRDGNVTTTTTYPDGSKSVVEVKTDGTIVSTDTDAQGNTATVTQNPDGSSVKTVENIDGSSSIQNTTSDGQTSAMVNLPSETVDASNASGAPASLPMDAVTATKDSATAPVVMVNTANDEPVKVEIPVTNANNGTVAVLVKADGTEEIIKTTALTGDGVAVKVNSGDTVKIIDNTKTFSDTATHWGSDAVTFVAARELFSGTSETRFSPDDNMTRGMLMTVLARYENVDTNGGSVWYEKGVAWAVAQGLSDGTNPNGQISREQLATIIYRYAQSKGIDTTAGGSLERFPDAGSVSDWAREAMSWAVGNGIISGVGGVTLDPSGNATRAQVATILMRFSEKFPA